MNSLANIHRFLFFPVSEKIREQIAMVEGSISGFSLMPLHRAFMDNMFLQLTGLIEQKISTFQWYIGLFNPDVRQDIKNSVGRQSIGRDALETNYNNFKSSCGKDNDNSLWTKDDILKNSHATIVSIFTDTCFSEINFRSFCEFKENRPIKTTDWKLSNPRRYDQFINYRHQLAHNFLSVKNDLPLLNELSNDDFKYGNDFYRFTICVYLDTIFMEIYKKYI